MSCFVEASAVRIGGGAMTYQARNIQYVAVMSGHVGRLTKCSYPKSAEQSNDRRFPAVEVEMQFESRVRFSGNLEENVTQTQRDDYLPEAARMGRAS